MKRILTLLLFVALSFTLLACGGNNDNSGNNDNNNDNSGDTNNNNNNQNNNGGDNEQTTVGGENGPHARTDNREKVYAVYAEDGTEIERFASMYLAIVKCVNEGYPNDYVAHVDTTVSSDEDKLFINYERYDSTTQDMFWRYDGTEFGDYAPWENTYWEDLQDTNYINLYKNAGKGGVLKSYYNAHKLVNGKETSNKSLQSWNARTSIESSITVHVDKFQGFTESEYTIELSKAEIYPSYKGADKSWAFLGFETADANYVAHNGIKCDTATGNWYYYFGEADATTNKISLDDSKVIMTSTWNEEKGCYIPDSDVTLKMELLLIDKDGNLMSVEDYNKGESPFVAHRLTITTDNGTFVEDYEYGQLNLCGSIRFECGLDIEAQAAFPDYQCGGEFKNVVITKGTVTILQRTIDHKDIYYGSSETIKMAAGTYDMLNSTAGSAARYYTMIYTPCCVDYNFDVEGQDVYSFSFDFE